MSTSATTASARTTVVTVTILSLIIALVALAWPEGAATLASVLIGVVLLAVAIEAVRHLAQRLPHPDQSAFDRVALRQKPELPGDLQSLAKDLDRVSPKRQVPDNLQWRLQRAFVRRLAIRHQIDVSEPEGAARARTMLSPPAFDLTQSEAGKCRLAGAAIPHLLDELEQL